MLPLAVKSQTGEIKLILGSGSARRKFLLETAGFKFKVVQSNFPENLDKSQFLTPLEYVRATCLGKLEALSFEIDNQGDSILIACDTVIVRDNGSILEKPADWHEAFEMIKSLLGHCVKVISVVYLKSTRKTVCFSEETELFMKSEDEDEISILDIEGYLSDINYKDLAGGLAIQSSGMVFVKSIRGCYHNIMGFPVSKFYQELKKFVKK